MRKSISAIIVTAGMVVASSASANNIHSALERVQDDMNVSGYDNVNVEAMTSNIENAVKRASRAEDSATVISGDASVSEAAKTL